MRNSASTSIICNIPDIINHITITGLYICLIIQHLVILCSNSRPSIEVIIFFVMLDKNIVCGWAKD
jgi:hypothetical protein